MVASVGKIKPLGKQLLPAIFTVGCGRVGCRLGAVRVVRVLLVERGVDAGRRREEDPTDTRHPTRFQHIHVDECRIAHDDRIVVAAEEITGTPHVGRELVNLIKRPVDTALGGGCIPQVGQYKIISRAGGEFGMFQVNATHPHPLMLQRPDKMMADEATGAADERRSHDGPPACASIQAARRSVPFSACHRRAAARARVTRAGNSSAALSTVSRMDSRENSWKNVPQPKRARTSAGMQPEGAMIGTPVATHSLITPEKLSR